MEVVEMRVAHLSSVHSRADARIFLKECRALNAAGNEVTLVVADGGPTEIAQGIRVVGVRKRQSRLRRMLLTPVEIYKVAKKIDADVYHLHDPELLPIGLCLKRLHKRVIFDAHEDVRVQLLSKPYLGGPALAVVSVIYGLLERYALRRFDLLLTVTPFIQAKLEKINPKVALVRNYPIVSELFTQAQGNATEAEVAYIGGITENRGARKIVDAVGLARHDVVLNMAGGFSPSSFRSELASRPGWRRVKELGILDRNGVRATLAKSVAGLVTLYPTGNYIESLPIKMFEYMSAGIPVIASNFPIWREIIEVEECGICVDPLDERAIADAIDWIIENPSDARRMGQNGRRAVIERYNWERESENLLRAYRELLN